LFIPKGQARVDGLRVVAGILPAVEPGFQPGEKSVEHSEALEITGIDPGGRMPAATL